MGVTYRSIRLDRTGLSPLKDIVAFIDFVRMFRELCPDIVLCYTVKPVIYGSLAAWLAGVRHIYSIITGLGYVFIGNSWKQKLLRPFVCKLYWLALNRNTNIFFLNHDDKKTFYSYGIIVREGTDIRLNGEGVDTTLYSHRTSIENVVPRGSSVDTKYSAVNKSDNTKISFLLIARLIWDKGILEYVEAAKIISAKYNFVKFKLLGPFDCNPAAISKQQIDQWQASGAIEYLGETKDVRPFIANSSVYVLPSYREGLPRTILEAMAMGTPIITTDAPGCRETVTDGDNGFLVPVKDAEALAAAMEKFILHPELVDKMGKRCREIAEENYDVHKVNAVILRHMGLLNETSI